MFELSDLQEGDFRWRTAEDAKTEKDGETVAFTQAEDRENRTVNLTFADMIGVADDDIKWEKFMNQLTWDELVQIVSQGRKMVVALDDFGMPSAWHDNGPTCVQQVDYGSGCILAATWNTDMAKLMGRMMGNECLWIGMHGWYGPSLNIHRSPFGGRNNEYFSEDGYLAGVIAAHEITEVQKKGTYAMAKHFALNEQETARSGVATYVDEQTMREIYLKPFQMAVEEGGSLGLMTAMNKIGDHSSYASYALDKLILRGEWDFRGLIVTDSGPTGIAPEATSEKYPVAATFVNLWQQNLSGNDLTLDNISPAKLKYFGQWDAAKQTVVYTPEEGEPVESTSFWLAVRESAKRILFDNAWSNLSKNGVDVSPFKGEKTITVGKDVEFYESIAVEGELQTKDIRYYISDGELPEGVTLNGATGQLSGTVEECGEYAFRVTMQADAWNQASMKVILKIVPSAKIAGLENLTVGTPVEAAVSTDFIYPDYRRIGPIKAGIQLWWITLEFHYEIVDGELPEGLTMAEDGTITGTPTKAGTYTFVVNIAASEEASALKQYNTAVTPDYLTEFTVTVAE